MSRTFHPAAGVAMLLAMLVVEVGTAHAETAPPWLDAALKRPIPAAGASDKTPLIWLHDEERIEVTRTHRRARVRAAVKILTIEGQRSFALLAAQGLKEEFRLVGGWTVRPDGEVSRHGAKAIAQMDADATYEFTMRKVNVFRPVDARVGDVVAWEYATRDEPDAYQITRALGSTSPKLLSRLAIKVPPGWSVSALTLDHPDIPPAKDGEGYTVWEASNLSAVKAEPFGVPLGDSVARLLVRWSPPDGEADVRRFESWESVARWYAGIVDRQVVADDEIRRTATQLATGAADRMDAIRSIARFVQGLRYLNTAAGRSTAEPHPAPQVLRNRFGDCEDKSVLTMALLREIGVDAYAMLALTSDEGSVVPGFPAPNVFNHAIVAVKPPGDAQTDLPSVIDAGSLGRLIVFDPTSSSTGFGDLPRNLQGTRATLAHPTQGGLVSLPVLPADLSRRESEARITFAEGGGVDVRLTARFNGQYAAEMRDHYGAVRGEKRKEEFLAWLSGHYGKVEIRSFEVSGVEDPDLEVVRDVDLWMPIPGKDLGSLRAMAASFHLFTRADRLNEAARETPLRIDVGYMESDRTALAIPSGWKAIDPLPSAEVSSAAGTYSIHARLDGDKVLIERVLKVNAVTVPPDGYSPVKTFFDEVLKGDTSVIAMEKRPD